MLVRISGLDILSVKFRKLQPHDQRHPILRHAGRLHNKIFFSDVGLNLNPIEFRGVLIQKVVLNSTDFSC